jgi:hypothetical protein
MLPLAAEKKLFVTKPQSIKFTRYTILEQLALLFRCCFDTAPGVQNQVICEPNSEQASFRFQIRLNLRHPVI